MAASNYQQVVADKYTFTPFLGQVGCRTFIPDSINAGITSQMNVRAEYARDSISSLQLVYGNFYCPTTGEANAGGTRYISCSVEYPVGTTPQRVFFGGSPNVTMADGIAQQVSDTLSINIPRGAMFIVRTYQTAPAGILFSSTYKTYGVLGDRTHTSNAAIDGTMDQNYAGGSLGGNPYGPYAIIAMTTRAAVAGVGDSRLNGATTTANSSIYTGEVQPGIAPYFGYMDLSRGSQTAEMLATGGQFSKRSTYLQYATHVVLQSGINDVTVNGRTAVQTLGYRDTIRSTAPSKIWIETTLAPKTTSTDSWATLANQTIDAVSNQPRIDFNTQVRAGRNGYAGYLDLADTMESARNSGIIKAAPMVPGAVSTDGLHANNFGYALNENSVLTSFAAVDRR